jgi:2-isopropylmalate synthase
MDTNKQQERKWYQSELNRCPEVERQMSLPKKVTIFDSTLREGEETPGVIMTVEDKVTIAKLLEDLGVRELEVGYPGQIEEHAEAFKALKKAGISIKIGTLIRLWCDDWKRQIDKCVELGSDILELPSPASNYNLAFRNAKRGQFIDRLLEMTEYAKSTGIMVDFYPYDSVRVDLSLMKAIVRMGIEAGADRIHLSDTLNLATPIATRYFFQEIKKVVGNIPVQYHCHNDFGMAVANTCAVVEGGAEIVDVTINGMGDRSGNANFQEVVMALKCLYGVETGIKTEKLYDVCHRVEQITKWRLEDNKPIIGRSSFVHESDIHVQAIIGGHWPCFEPYLPEVVGQKRVVWYGTTTTRDSVVLKGKIMGIKLTPEQVEIVWSKIKQEIAKKNHALEEEVEAFIKKVA